MATSKTFTDLKHRRYNTQGLITVYSMIFWGAVLTFFSQTTQQLVPFLSLPYELKHQVYNYLPPAKYATLARCCKQLLIDVEALIFSRCELCIEASRRYSRDRLSVFSNGGAALRSLHRIPKRARDHIENVVLGVCEPTSRQHEHDLRRVVDLVAMDLQPKHLTVVYHMPTQQHNSFGFPRVPKTTAFRMVLKMLEEKQANTSPKKRLTHEIDELGQRIVTQKLILLCNNINEHSMSNISQAITHHVHNPIQNLEVWLPGDEYPMADFDHIHRWYLAQGICGYALFFGDSFLYPLLDIKGLQSVSILAFDNSQCIHKQRESVRPLPMEGLQEYLDEHMVHAPVGERYIGHARSESMREMDLYLKRPCGSG